MLTSAVVLCHHGSWRQDLNVELLTPFTKNIASLWGKLFKTNLFQAFQGATLATIKKLLVDFESSVETSTSFWVTRKLEYLIRPGISATQLV